MGNAIKTYKRIYIYYNRRSRFHSVVSPDRLFRPANDWQRFPGKSLSRLSDLPGNGNYYAELNSRK